MFENIMNFFKSLVKKEKSKESSDTAKERLHLVLMQDRANVSADFLELMKQEIIEVIKKYIEVDEGAIDVRLTNKENEDGTNGAPALYANIPIKNIKNEARKVDSKEVEKKKAEKEIIRIDKLRENHYKYYTDKKWKDFSNYDICINSDKVGVEKAADLIVEMAKDLESISSQNVTEEITR